VPYARERLEASYNYIEQQDVKLEELTIENKLLMRENSKAQSEVRRQAEITMDLMEEKNTIKQELELRSYQMIQLKRDAECYSRYFAQVDDKYEGLRAQICELKPAQRESLQERTDDNSECDEDVKAEYGDFFHFGDYDLLSPECFLIE
jgi:hypothetical protein